MKYPDTPFFTGHNAPVRMEVNLPYLVTSGELPDEIRGTWYRMTAEPMFPPKDGNDIMVAGDGMISSLRIEDGGVHFRTRYVQTERLQREMAAGRGLYGFYRNPFRDDPSVQGTHRGTANTTPIWHAGRLLCAKEIACPTRWIMMHDFAVSRDHVVFMAFPTTSDLERLKAGGPHWVWDGSKPTWFGVLRRDQPLDTIRWFQWNAAYSFHVMNTVSHGNRVEIDMMLARRNPFPEIEAIDGAPYNPEEGAPFLTRLSIDLDADDGNIQARQLSPMPGDMPLTIDVDQMRPYQIGYYAGIDPSHSLPTTLSAAPYAQSPPLRCRAHSVPPSS